MTLLAAALQSAVAPVAIVQVTSTLFPIVYANAAFERLTKYAAVELTGRDCDFVFDAGMAAETRMRLRSALQQGTEFAEEVSGTRKEGGVFWARLHLKPIQAADQTTYFLMSCEDVTPQRLLKERLRASDARLDVAMAASSLAMWDWNMPLDEIYYNEHWRTVLGVEPESLLRLQDRAERLALPPDDLDILTDFEQHLLSQQEADFVREYQLRVPSGNRKWVSARIRVVQRDSAGRALRVVGALSDITASKESLKLMQETRQSWERAVEGTSDGLFDWDLNTGHVWYAPRFRELLGFTAEQFPDTFTAFKRVLHPDDEFLVLSKVRSHLEQCTSLDLRCRVATQTGPYRWFRLRAEAQRDAARRPRRLAGSIRDISAQIEAEEALHKSRDFYGTILDALPLCIGYVDRDERVIFANRAFQLLFKQSFSPARGRSLQELLGAASYVRLEGKVALALSGKCLEAQIKLPNAAGDQEFEASYLPHYSDRAEIDGCFVVARDVTERRKLDLELRQSQKMEAIGRLTGGMAHDFNNLLSIVIGNSQLLARALEETPRLLKYAETVLQAAVRGSELTRRLLTFARGHSVELRVVEANRLLMELHELLKRMLSGAAELDLNIDDAAWPIKIDVGQFENAILNLAINARDAMPQGGRISLQTSQLVIEANNPRAPVAAGEYTVVSVVDTGIGMSPHILKRVFEPFFTTKDIGKGSGLGLAMVYGFMQQCGGHVAIDSTLGEGTCVRLYFPRAQEPLSRNDEELELGGDLPRGTEVVMVVEDDPEVRITAVSILTNLGYRVLDAADGHQALSVAAAHPEIAMVFSDVMLPGGMMGSALVHKLRERRPGLKALLTSGFSDTLILRRDLPDTDLEILDKPYAVAQLARRVRQTLDKPSIEEESYCVEPSSEPAVGGR